MADNVDISLKLGTEADISSAINAGARAGAAFAAAAQSAVSGIQLNASATMRAFQTSSRQYSSTSDIAKEIRSLGLTTGLAAQLATGALARTGFGSGGNGGGGWGAKPFAPVFPEPNRRGTSIVSYGSNAPYGAFTYQNGKMWAWDEEDKIYREVRRFTDMYTKVYNATMKGGGGGYGGGGGPLLLTDQRGGGKDITWRQTWGVLAHGIAAAKVSEQLFQPFADEYLEKAVAGYRAQTSRSAQGFRQEKLEREFATLNRRIGITNWAYPMAGAAWGAYMLAGTKLGATIGTAVSPGAGSLAGAIGGAVVGGAIAGVAGLVHKTILKEEKEKTKEEMKQQQKTLEESQKRYYANTLFKGNYNVSYQQAIADLGVGFTEEGILNNSVQSLNFRGRLMRGLVGEQEMQSLAFMPNLLAARINGETDPHKLNRAIAADLYGLGDESLAASVAETTPGVGLGTWVGVQTQAFEHATNRFNTIALNMHDAEANAVIGGYMSKQAQNVIETQIANSAQMIRDAYNAPASFYNGVKPSEHENKLAEVSFDAARNEVMEGSGKVYNFQIYVDGEKVKEEQIKERDLMFQNGMSFISGGI